ncbi:MAG: DNA methyltransferase [Shewanella sp.]
MDIPTSALSGDVVADFFMGYGSTIKAALKLGRKAIGVELEEETYLKVKEQLQI